MAEAYRLAISKAGALVFIYKSFQLYVIQVVCYSRLACKAEGDECLVQRTVAVRKRVISIST